MKADQVVTLVGDGIENPANALTMVHAAEMFRAACRFRDTKGLADSITTQILPEASFASISTTEIQSLHSRTIAFENLSGAREVFGFSAGRAFAVLVGNEKRGLSHELVSLATDCVHLPMLSRRINCLNVAAASAVALYYLCRPPVGPMRVRNDPRSRRPELLCVGPGDQFELGSTIRSAAALGWERVFIEDRHGVWFGCNRAVRSEGRAAARRGRNDIRVIPCPTQTSLQYPRVTVITCKPIGIPLHRANLAPGPSHLVVIPDEGRNDFAAENWSWLGQDVSFAHLQLPEKQFPYHYRLVASIALAEISRQVGRRPTVKAPLVARPPIYDHALKQLAEAAGGIISWEELQEY